LTSLYLFDIIDKMSQLGDLEQLVLLALLQLGDNAYGVSIRDLLAKRSRRDVALATVYTTLDRLSAKGLIHSRLGDPTPERGGRRKRFYRISAEGRQTLKRPLAAVRALSQGLGADLQP
jgi:DNA-binding PadR family transcriptional regulator